MDYLKDLKFVLKDCKATFIKLKADYVKESDQKIKLIDRFIGFCICVFAFSIAYRFIMPKAPMNALLSAVFISLGEASLAMSLRVKITDDEFKHECKKRAFIEFFGVSLLLCVVSFYFMQ